MKRAVLILLVLAVIAGAVVAGAVAVWWWMQRAPAATTEVPQGFVSSDRLSISSVAAAPAWDAASPVTLRVTLLRPPGVATEWSEGRPWWEGVTLHRLDGEGELPVEFEIIEPRRNPAADDEVQFTTLSFSARQLPAGAVVLRARLERRDGAPLLSRELQGRVRRGVRTARERALAEARVHLGAGRFDAALAALTTVGPPETADVQLLRADALAGVGRVEEAIKLFHAVLAEVPDDQPEPPLYVLRRLQELEEGRER